MTDLTVTYAYPPETFINTSYMGIPNYVDYADIDIKLRSFPLKSAVYSYVSNIYYDNGTMEYLFTFTNALSTDDKIALDHFMEEYVYIPMNDSACIAREVKPLGVNAGGFKAGVWTVRKLNRLEGMMRFATLDCNKITVIPGVYIVTAKVTACNVGANRVRIKNITNDTYTYGPNASANSGYDVWMSEVSSYLNFTEESTFQIEHICAITCDEYGLGKATNIEPEEIYTTVFVRQITSY
jgi:hypothetical protein